MRLMFIGADREVTGSCHYIEALGKHILIDCGMEQGEDVYQNQEFPVAIADIDFILLTHAHIDHSGLLPLMYGRGFRGEIFATAPTCDLCNIMLKDSAHIQMFEAEWRNRKGKRAGKEEYVPLYTMEDAEGVLELFHPCDYQKTITIHDGIDVTFVDAGHLLGSSSIEIQLYEFGIEKTIVFSGDIGNSNQPLIKDPSYLSKADYVVMEATYGDRNHNINTNYSDVLSKIIKNTFDLGGNLLIPSFAVGRTQEMLYFIRKIKEDQINNPNHILSEYPNFDVYVDSPLAIEATTIFNKNMATCFDDEAMDLVQRGINPISFKGLKTAVTSEESKRINSSDKPKIIISASGMCEAGRIKHHLKHNLWREESTILFVGYQAVGTLGRALLEGAKEVKLFGETIEVKAKIDRLDGISSHADKDGLIRWLSAFNPKPSKVFIVHGEDSVCGQFADSLKNEYGYNSLAPYSGTIYDLAFNKLYKEGNTSIKDRVQYNVKKPLNGVYARLMAAGQRLLSVIKHNEGGANKDLAKLADQINSLCDKWDR